MAERRTGGARRALALTLVVAGLLLASPARPVAHDIPADVTVQAFVAPQGDRLRLLVRVPLEAMRDFLFPQRGPGYLDLAAADSMLRDAIMVWVGDGLAVYEDDRQLVGQQLRAVRVSLPSDRSFASYESALAHVTGPPLPVDTEIVWQQAVLDALFEYEIESDESRFAIDPSLGRLGIRTITVLRFVLPDGAVRAFEYSGNPGLVRLDPRWHQAALRFVALGFEHIPGRHRPPAVSRLPGDPVPALHAARRHSHFIHRRALGDAHRVRLRSGARRPVVPAARRDADCTPRSSTWRSRTSPACGCGGAG